MKYDLNRIVDRTGTNSLKWEFGSRVHPKVTGNTLPLWVADMDFPCAEPILLALRKRIDREIFGYSLHYTGEYFRAVCSWMQRRFNWWVHSEDIFVAPGIVPALSDLVRCFSKEGDGVIIQRPVYGPFTSRVERNGRFVVDNALINKDGYYSMDFDDLEAKASDPKNTMMILCSPHNPVGRVWTEEELKKVADICFSNDVVLVSDEIHYDIVRSGETHLVLDSLFPGDDRIITCTAPSKSFNLAGMQVSHIVIRNDEYKKRWEAATGHPMLSPLAITAVQAAYNESEDWLGQVNDYIDLNLEFIHTFLKEHLPDAVYRVPEGTYLAWIDLGAYVFEGDSLTDFLIEDAGVFIDGGNKFGPEYGSFQRINAACPRAILEDCLGRVASSLKKRSSK
ncbi:MAG: pyridoxal phosphate-dependent aminotransferase [Spirochaetales bacterium]|nr:pyridoxal phosphate-dependent aminotransferase [Spirochaetales bacterium]